MGKLKLWHEWRPGCFARDGERCMVGDGTTWWFEGGRWVQHAIDVEGWGGLPTPPFLRSFPCVDTETPAAKKRRMY